MKNNFDLFETGIFLFIVAIVLAIFLIFLKPALSDIADSLASIVLAIGTFLMVLVSYRSYRTLTKIQKASLEPYLSVYLRKDSAYGADSLSFYWVTIRNDGPGIAKNVRLHVNWAYRKIDREKIKNGKNNRTVTQKLDWKDEDFLGESFTEEGNIASKDQKDILDLTLPGNHNVPEVYGIKISVSCEDILGNSDPKYGESKKIYLSNAKFKSKNPI